MITVKDNTKESIDAALIRLNVSQRNETVIQNNSTTVNLSKTNQIIKLSDGQEVELNTLRQQANSLSGTVDSLMSLASSVSKDERNISDIQRSINELKGSIDRLQINIDNVQKEVRNINVSTVKDGDTSSLVFQNWLGLPTESELPVVSAQYSTNAEEWHNIFTEGDIYIRFSYDSGSTWTDPIKIVGQDGSAYGYYGLVYNQEELPPAFSGNFFLCAEDFTGYITKNLIINNKLLVVGDKTLTVRVAVQFEKGFIYEFKNDYWEPVIDKNDYRYVIAINDLYVIGEEVSSNLLLQFQSSIIKYTPRYLGGFSVAPTVHNNGDTFCYTGTTTGQFTRGRCYQWGDSFGWTVLDSTLPENAEIYMKALNDILKLNDGSTGNFGSVFSANITSNSGFIKNFASQHITMQIGGVIDSQDYIKGISGFKIDNKAIEIQDGKFNGSISNSIFSATKPNLEELTYNGLIKAVFEGVFLCPAIRELAAPIYLSDKGMFIQPCILSYINDELVPTIERFSISSKPEGQMTPFYDEYYGWVYPYNKRIMFSGYYATGEDIPYSDVKIFNPPNLSDPIVSYENLKDWAVYVDEEGYLKLKVVNKNVIN